MDVDIVFASAEDAPDIAKEAEVTIHIRTALPSDVPAVAVLFDAYRQFYGQPSDINLAQRFIGERTDNGQSVILLAEVKNEGAIGFCQLYPTFSSVSAASVFILNDLFVSAGHRRSGAGRALLEAAAGYAVEVGAIRLSLSTAKDNLPAQKLYESLGWQKDEQFLHYNLAVPRKV